MKINKLSHRVADFPSSLHHLYDCPDAVYYSGQMPQTLCLAVIGSRRMTAYGREAMQLLLPPLIKKGVGIISGLAFGVDALAHRLALGAGGYTLAVLPGGLPDIYPSSHTGLASDIVDSGGCLISEFSGPHDVRRHDFLRRNRLVAALADAVLVIEAAERSGTTSTVGFALELGRPVLAVPGNITAPASRGTNAIIRNGAIPVTSADDIAQELGLTLGTESGQPSAYNNEEAAIINALSEHGPLDIEQLMVQSGLALRQLQTTITAMELRGAVRPHGAQVYGLAGHKPTVAL